MKVKAFFKNPFLNIGVNIWTFVEFAEPGTTKALLSSQTLLLVISEHGC